MQLGKGLHQEEENNGALHALLHHEKYFYWSLNASNNLMFAIVWVNFCDFVLRCKKVLMCTLEKRPHNPILHIYNCVSLSVVKIEEINNKHDRLRRATTIIIESAGRKEKKTRLSGRNSHTHTMYIAYMHGVEWEREK